MAKADNGSRGRKAGSGPRGFTVTFAPELFARAKRYKNEIEIREQRKVTWTEIVSAALQDYLKRKGA